MDANSSPALVYRSENYPASWHGRVPKRVRMCKTIRSDIPVVVTGSPLLVAGDHEEYDVWVNSHGAVAAVMGDGRNLGLKPYEFEIVEWHKTKKED